MSTSSRSISAQLIFWCVLAAIAGVGCLVLPPYFVHNGLTNRAYGWPLIPWFAFACANQRVLPSMASFFILGLILGIAQPRRWWLMAIAAVVMSPVLLTINIVHDWNHDPTSHNLFPFEFAIYGFICAPAFIGALIGFLLLRSRPPLAQKCVD
jgi:hypothetical protein